MIDHSPVNVVFIRICAVLLQYAPLIETILVAGLVAYSLLAPGPVDNSVKIAVLISASLLILELSYALLVYRKHKVRLLREANYPEPLTSVERAALFERCLENVLDRERYLQLWFLGAPISDIKRQNVREFLLWAFFDQDGYEGRAAGVASEGDQAHGESEQEVERYVDRIEEFLGRKIPPGRGPATSLRLSIDAIHARYRSVVWYSIVGLVDLQIHVYLSTHGFRHYFPSLHATMSVFPPRIQALPNLWTKRLQSASSEIGYWLRPHTSKTRIPVVFLHGIGIGLWPYARIIAEISGLEDADDGQIGVLALEILPMSFRLTSPPLPKEEFLAHLTAILRQHAPQWNEFLLVSHSYGSVLTTHMLRSPSLGPRIKGVLLIDPVSILLHLPDIAYNFTRRKPRTANEWQLWYFASMDLGVAEGLGRHFFWRENIIWREELATLNTNFDGSIDAPFRDDDNDDDDNNDDTRADSAVQDPTKQAMGSAKRHVAVFLSGKDIILDSRAVAQYLAARGTLGDSQDEDLGDIREMLTEKKTDGRLTCRSYVSASGIEISWFPLLDHSQLFERRETRDRVLDTIRRYTLKELEMDN